jgi:hypothetical protein
VLKLSNGVMFRVPVEVQGMQLQAVVDTAAQVTLVSEDSSVSLLSLLFSSPTDSSLEDSYPCFSPSPVPPDY